MWGQWGHWGHSGVCCVATPDLELPLYSEAAQLRAECATARSAAPPQPRPSTRITGCTTAGALFTAVADERAESHPTSTVDYAAAATLHTDTADIPLCPHTHPSGTR